MPDLTRKCTLISAGAFELIAIPQISGLLCGGRGTGGEKRQCVRRKVRGEEEKGKVVRYHFSGAFAACVSISDAVV